LDNQSHFDYIIVGAGAAGLMLADAMCSDEFFKEKSVLILDKDSKQVNDRTWCYWEKGAGPYEAIVHRKWNHIYFAGKKIKNRYAISPYVYKMIRGIDFYNLILARVATNENVSFQLGEVTAVQDDGNRVSVTASNETYYAKKVFNSIFDYKMARGQTKYPVLQQHFIGWFIKTDHPVFEKDQATFMDFSIPQKNNTRFMYVLPISETEALVEYTLFSETLLPKEEYEKGIQDYLTHELSCDSYEILEKEQGSIPMTSYDFTANHSKNVLFIGTAGGWSKPSTGYTFMNTINKIPMVINHLKSDKALNQLRFKNKFWYYDLLLLDVLYKNNALGSVIFETLFRRRKPQLIFKFLNEKTSFIEDFKFILGCPKWPFIEAFCRRLFKL